MVEFKKIFEDVFACNGENDLHKLITKNQDPNLSTWIVFVFHIRQIEITTK